MLGHRFDHGGCTGRTAEGLQRGSEAQRLASELGQTDLARAIAVELAKLK